MVQAVQVKPVAVAMARFLARLRMVAVPYFHAMAAGLVTAHGAVGAHVPQAVAVARKRVLVAVHAPTQALHVVVQAVQAPLRKPRAKAVTPIAVQ